MEYESFNIDPNELNNFNKNHININKIKYNLNGKTIIFIHFNSKKGINKDNNIKNLDLEFINKSDNNCNIYFYNYLFFDKNKFYFFNQKNPNNTEWYIYFDNRYQELFKDKNGFIESFLRNLFDNSDHLKIPKGNILNFTIRNYNGENNKSNRFMEINNDKEDGDKNDIEYDKIIKELSKGKYELKTNNNAMFSKFKYFGFPGSNDLSFSIKRVR